MNNAIAYCAQVLLLVLGGGVLVSIFRLRAPQVRLWFWQGLLVGCLLLPFVQPRRDSGVTVTVAEGALRAGTPVKMPAVRQFPVADALRTVYVIGLSLRAVWLLLGCWRLRRYRRHSEAAYFESPAVTTAQRRLRTFPEIRVSQEITTPVTFGSLILLPPSFAELDEGAQQAIAVHELMHVKRGDWLFCLGEEVVRSVFWFHPAIWWLLAQIQLTREQVADRATIEFILSREQYLEALLAVAKTKVRPDLALAPLFLKKRHLARRVAAVLNEARMSKRQIISSLTSVFTLAAVTAGVAISLFPLESSAQTAGALQPVTVDVDTRGHKLLHAGTLDYRSLLHGKRTEGTVFLQVSTNGQGEVSEARVESGPEELRAAAQSLALQWHFVNNTGQPETIEASVTFKSALPVKPFVRAPLTLKAIAFGAMPVSLVEALKGRINVREGDQLTAETIQQVVDIAQSVDRHLSVHVTQSTGDASAVMMITLGETSAGPAPSPASAFDPPTTPGVRRIRVGGNVQSAKIISKVTPSYPPSAKEARIQGTVRYNVLIGVDGSIKNMELVAGHPLFVEVATPAVQQWKYSTTLLNGDPVEVMTVIDVNFTLSQ
ncbi:MAG: M56 family metallopeptidase [Bryobacteraceae bacterium]